MKGETIGFLLAFFVSFVPAVLIAIYMISQINWVAIDNPYVLLSAIFVVGLPGAIWMSFTLVFFRLIVWGAELLSVSRESEASE